MGRVTGECFGQGMSSNQAQHLGGYLPLLPSIKLAGPRPAHHCRPDELGSFQRRKKTPDVGNRLVEAEARKAAPRVAASISVWE